MTGTQATERIRPDPGPAPAAPAAPPSWAGFVLVGVLLMVFGAAAIWWESTSTVVTSKVFGTLLAIGGVISVVQALRARDWSGVNGQLVIGAAEVVGGIFIVLSPMKGAAAITLLVAIVVGALGVTQAGLALKIRPQPGWGWLILAAFVSCAIAVGLVLRFPFQYAQTPGAMAGIALAFGGVAHLMIGLGRRRSIAGSST